VGTGSGILALAAARAGAASVVALDINPTAAKVAAENAHANGLGKPIRAVGSNLLSALTPRPLFDVILSSPPSFAGGTARCSRPGLARRTQLFMTPFRPRPKV
jgi:release factor glutamine methyltransferase